MHAWKRFNFCIFKELCASDMKKYFLFFILLVEEKEAQNLRYGLE